MKSNSLFTAAAPWHLLRAKQVQAYVAWLLLLSFLPMATGCNYYRVQYESPVTNEKLAGIPNYKRFIVHQGGDAYELKNVAVTQEAVTGTLQSVAGELVPHLNPTTGSPHKYARTESEVVLNLVHLYVFEMAKGENNAVSIPLSAISRIDITEKDEGATVASYAVTTVGILAASFALLAVLVALLKSSCPYVYVHNGEHFVFTGEAYGGAIYAPLERHDYMPLPRLKAKDGTYQVKIANELKERQYTNLADLVVVEHPPHIRVLLDQQGQVHTILQLQPAFAALAGNGENFSTQLSTTDSSSYHFDDATTNFNQLTLQFKKPAAARTAKLVLNARNSLWLDYMYGEFISQFGSYYNTWAESQKKEPVQKLMQWQQEQGLLLAVEVQTAQGWQQVQEIPTVGPLASRDLVIRVNLDGVQGEQLNIRLSSGFMFWEIDQAGIDFTENVPVQVHTVKPAVATEKKGWDVRPLLAADDDQYLKQPNVGDEVLLSYPLPPQEAGMVQTSFLHTKGYCEHIRDFKGMPDIFKLRTFKEPGRFITFSRERYEQALQIHQLTPLANTHAVAP